MAFVRIIDMGAPSPAVDALPFGLMTTTVDPSCFALSTSASIWLSDALDEEGKMDLMVPGWAAAATAQDTPATRRIATKIDARRITADLHLAPGRLRPGELSVSFAGITVDPLLRTPRRAPYLRPCAANLQ